MITFLQASLAVIAACTPLGLAAPFALAAKHRRPGLAFAAAVAGAWMMTVCVAAAVML